MTAPTFSQALAASGMTAREFCRLVKQLSGYHLQESTVSRWRNHPPKNSAPAMSIAVAALCLTQWIKDRSDERIQKHDK